MYRAGYIRSAHPPCRVYPERGRAGKGGREGGSGSDRDRQTDRGTERASGRKKESKGERALASARWGRHAEAK